MDMKILIGANATALLLIVPWVGVLLEVCARAIRALP
jgi:hypothetical protein